MRRGIQSYLVFVPVLSRLLLLLVPAALAVLLAVIRPGDFILTLYVVAFVYMAAEMVLDGWSFGGIATKGNSQMEYLKTSKRGIGLVQRALAMNMGRQLLEGAILFLVFGAAAVSAAGSLPDARMVLCGVDVLLLTYVCIVGGLTIARHFDGMGAGMAATVGGYFLMLGGMYLIGTAGYLMLVVLALLAVAVSAAGIWTVTRRVKESYYDKTA